MWFCANSWSSRAYTHPEDERQDANVKYNMVAQTDYNVLDNHFDELVPEGKWGFNNDIIQAVVLMDYLVAQRWSLCWT